MSDTSLLIFTDGRQEYLAETLASLEANVQEDWAEILVIDDSTKHKYTEWLMAHPYLFERGARINWLPRKRGFAGAIQDAWKYVSPTSRYVFHMEDDFVFERPLDLAPMKEVLDVYDNVMQLALRRQPVSLEEGAAGGIIEVAPHLYHDHFNSQGSEWVQHREFFTTNPSLYRRQLCGLGWPDAPDSERKISDYIVNTSPDLVFAFWGPRTDPPWVRHIGHVRTGIGY